MPRYGTAESYSNRVHSGPQTNAVKQTDIHRCEQLCQIRKLRPSVSEAVKEQQINGSDGGTQTPRRSCAFLTAVLLCIPENKNELAARARR